MPEFQILTAISWKMIILGAALIFLFMASMAWVQSKLDPERGTMDFPDATAVLRGKCGDAMKIALKFENDRVAQAKYWTDGCRMSAACGAAAAKLALHKTPEEIADIDHTAIIQEVGDLPEEDFHCATLAAGTLQEAVRLYLVGDTHGAKNKGVNQNSAQNQTAGKLGSA